MRKSHINSLPAIDEISRQLRVNASPPLTSFYGNPCSRYITVRKALAHVLNELRDFRVRHSKMIGITQKKSVDHITLKWRGIQLNRHWRCWWTRTPITRVLIILNPIGTKSVREMPLQTQQLLVSWIDQLPVDLAENEVHQPVYLWTLIVQTAILQTLRGEILGRLILRSEVPESIEVRQIRKWPKSLSFLCTFGVI